jgi:hypothetical protein
MMTVRVSSVPVPVTLKASLTRNDSDSVEGTSRRQARLGRPETPGSGTARRLNMQLNYAALDVAHMLIVYGKLLQLLKKQVIP